MQIEDLKNAKTLTVAEQTNALISNAVVRMLTPHYGAVRLSPDRIHQRLENDLAAQKVMVSMTCVKLAINTLIANGMVEEAGTGYQLTKAGLVATRPIGNELTGASVKVRHEQNCLGKPKYPGRQGTVLSENPFGKGSNGGLWNVRLDATNRAGEREESFWGKDLEVL